MTVDLTRWFAGIMGMGQGARPMLDLAELDTRVRGAVDTLPVTLFEVDANGDYTCAAGGYINLFGISPSLLVGRSIFDFPKFVPGKNVMVRRALAGESVAFTGIWPRGRFMIRLVPRRDQSGRVCAVVGLGFELTKPNSSDRHFEDLLEALRQSEARFRAMCDCAPLGILVSSKKLELAYANPALCRLLGRRPEELLGRKWVDLLPPEERERVNHALTEERARHLPDTLRFERPDGASVWTSLRMAAMRDDGELLGYVAVVADITQERAARLAIDAAQQDLRRVIEGSPEGIAVVRAGRWIFVNRALVQTLGCVEAEALLGRDVNEIVHPEDRPHLHGLISEPEALLLNGEARELRCRGARGEYVLLEMRPAALSEFEGAPALLISARDITEKKKLQARLAVTERLLAVGTLAAGVAHEINNPLSAALSNLEWVAGQLSKLTAPSSPILPAQLASGLTQLVGPIGDTLEACGRVKRIVQDLKLLSRAHEERLGPVEITEVIDSAVRMAWNELRHRARLVREYGDLPLVHGSEARLAQVFLNLLINATQAMPEGDAHRHEIHIAARAQGPDRVVVEIRDTGSGIPEEILGRIFDPFFTTKPPGIGTGLGLSICQRIISGMGGQIEVESRVGAGSMFRVTLASSKVKTLEALPMATEPELPASERARVLVIDDDPAVGSALELVLAEDYEVEVLTNAQRALDRLRDGQRYAAILCDLMMPELSGMDFHRELARSHPALATQVIFLTGGAFTPGADEFLDSVPNPRMGKPYSTRELRALIARQLTMGALTGLPVTAPRTHAEPSS
jgi:two-component system, cell cycle sensor histidine kinase and response regulator CckA